MCYHCKINENLIQCHFSFVNVSIDYPELYIETNDEINGLNATQAEWYTCEDIRHRCRWNQVEYDVNDPFSNLSLKFGHEICGCFFF